MADEHRHEQRGERVQYRHAEPDADQRSEHRCRRQDVAAGVLGVGQQNLARQPSSLPRLVRDHEQVDDERRRHQANAFGKHARCAAMKESIHRRPQDFDQDGDEEEQNRERGDRFVFAMAVRMIRVRGATGDRDPDQCNDIRGAIGKRMKTFGQDRNRAARVSERDLGERHGEVDPQHPPQHPRDFRVAISAAHVYCTMQKSRGKYAP